MNRAKSMPSTTVSKSLEHKLKPKQLDLGVVQIIAKEPVEALKRGTERWRDVTAMVLRDIRTRTQKQKHKSRPMRLEYGFIARRCGINYRQVRRIVRDLELMCEIECWVAWDSINCRRTKYYRVVSDEQKQALQSGK